MPSWIKNIKIGYRFIIINLIVVFGIIAVDIVNMHTLERELLNDRVIKTKHIVETAANTVRHYAEKANSGEITLDEAQASAKETIGAMRYDNGNYIWVNDYNGIMLQHADKSFIGTDFHQVKDASGDAFIAKLTNLVKKEGEGTIYYKWTKSKDSGPKDKLSYGIGYPQWGWIVASGIWLDDVDELYYEKLKHSMVVAGIILFIAVGISVIFAQSITQPLRGLGEVMLYLSEGDTSIDLKKFMDKSEVGDMARNVDCFREKISKTHELEEEQRQMEESVERDRKQALIEVLRSMVQISVECSHTLSLVTKMHIDVRKTNMEVQAMAGGVEEMRASIDEISRTSNLANNSARESKESANKGVRGAEQATSSMSTIISSVTQTKDQVTSLNAASEEIGAIIEQIENIAGQTNLLALNATIESARAGEAGKGFAVVANEVKSLANETGQSTEDIRQRITSLREQMSTIVTAMDVSEKSVRDGQEVVTDLSANLEQISGIVDGVAEQMVEISGILTQQSAASAEISESANKLSIISEQNATEISHVMDATAKICTLLNDKVETFKDLGPLAIIEVAKNDHMNFKRLVINTLAGREGKKASELTNHHQCRLGLWYDNAPSEIKSMDSYRAILEPHQKIHALGKEMLALHENRKDEEAIALIDDLDKLSCRVVDLLEALYKDVEKMGGMEI